MKRKVAIYARVSTEHEALFYVCYNKKTDLRVDLKKLAV